MKYYQYDTNDSPDKIPYDKEPILRQSSYKKQKSSPTASNKALTIVVCFLVVMNVVLGGLFISVLNKNSGGQVNNTTVNITAPAGEAVDVSAVTSKAKLSVVCVHAGVSPLTSETEGATASTEITYKAFFETAKSQGAGVIFKEDKQNSKAYIVTCYHVVKGLSTNVYVLLYDSFKPIKAKVVHYSVVYDIAVLEISPETDETNAGEFKISAASACEVADSSYLLEGEGAIAIGNPLGSGISATRGIISKTTEIVKIDGIDQRLLRTDAAINGGNSGGGLFNLKGELIGVVNAKKTDNPSADSYIDNVAYAIPSNLAISIANNILRSSGNVPTKAVLGIDLLVQNTGLTFDVVNGTYIAKQKVIVSLVNSSSAAAKAGIRQNDQIVSFSYGSTVVNVTNTYSIDDHLFNLNRGDKVQFTIIRTTTEPGLDSSGGGLSLNNKSEEIVVTVVIDEVVSADKQQWYS